jgi:hypothetical protein
MLKKRFSGPAFLALVGATASLPNSVGHHQSFLRCLTVELGMFCDVAVSGYPGMFMFKHWSAHHLGRARVQ